MKVPLLPLIRSALLLASLFLVSCSNNSEQLSLISGPIMGTTFNIKVVVDPDKTDFSSLKSSVLQSMNEVDKLMSTYKDDSDVSKLNRTPIGEWLAIDSLTTKVLVQAQEISRISGGAFDITVGPLVKLWGFGPQKGTYVIPPIKDIESAKLLVGFRKVEIEPDTSKARRLDDIYVDLSAIAKGFAVDQVADTLKKYGVHDYLVEIGGEIRASGFKPGKQPWILAIESPVSDFRQVFKKISIGNNALATSGDYRNFFEENGVRYSHTIDPNTGYPAQHRLTSVTVLRELSSEADAMATMFMVLGEDKGYELAKALHIPAYFIYHDGEGFSVKFTNEFEKFLIE